jgi:histidyl-tRNA synthetase
VDVVGSTSLTYEAELVQIYDEVFAALKIPVVIRINHRQLLFSLANECNIADKWIDMTMAIDKLDKIGEDGVRKEMGERDISREVQAKIFGMLSSLDIREWKSFFQEGGEGYRSIADIEAVFGYLKNQGTKNEVRFDPTLARGLGYYTGCIFEVNGVDADMGSLGGGGRYDDLTGVFGWPDIPGVGISFGAERMYDVLEAKKLFPPEVQTGPMIILAAMDAATHQYAFQCVSQLRQAGISADLYPEPGKLKKQIKYASDIGCRFMGIVGEDELKKESLMLKDLISGQQEEKTIAAIIQQLKS